MYEAKTSGRGWVLYSPDIDMFSAEGRPPVASTSYEVPPDSMPASGFVVERSMPGTWTPASVSPPRPACTARVVNAMVDAIADAVAWDADAGTSVRAVVVTEGLSSGVRNSAIVEQRAAVPPCRHTRFGIVASH